jgi:GWxTD domain-containing protein
MARIAHLPRLFLLLALPAAVSTAAPAPTLPELFQKAKEQVKLGSYDSALSTLEELDAASQQPGFEKDRMALGPVLAFYKGVCHAALGKTDEAREEFATFLASSPNTVLDPAIYPKKVVAAFEEAKKAPAAGKDDAAPKGMTAAYRAFKTPPADVRAPLGEEWADGPVRYLLSASEADTYRHLGNPASRSEFITQFWKARDPKPETPENEFRQEFEKRAAFADQYFGVEEKQGSLTDRGMVFVILGPPARSAERPLKTGDDSGDASGQYLNTPGEAQEAGIGGKGTGISRTQSVARMDATTGIGTTINAPSQNWKETWRYYRKDLAGIVPYEYVDFQFITKPGYGQNVLQRDQQPLDALARAKAALGKP